MKCARTTKRMVTLPKTRGCGSRVTPWKPRCVPSTATSRIGAARSSRALNESAPSSACCALQTPRQSASTSHRSSISTGPTFITCSHPAKRCRQVATSWNPSLQVTLERASTLGHSPAMKAQTRPVSALDALIRNRARATAAANREASRSRCNIPRRFRWSHSESLRSFNPRSGAWGYSLKTNTSRLAASLVRDTRGTSMMGQPASVSPRWTWQATVPTGPSQNACTSKIPTLGSVARLPELEAWQLPGGSP